MQSLIKSSASAVSWNAPALSCMWRSAANPAACASSCIFKSVVHPKSPGQPEYQLREQVGCPDSLTAMLQLFADVLEAGCYSNHPSWLLLQSSGTLKLQSLVKDVANAASWNASALSCMCRSPASPASLKYLDLQLHM